MRTAGWANPSGGFFVYFVSTPNIDACKDGKHIEYKLQIDEIDIDRGCKIVYDSCCRSEIEL